MLINPTNTPQALTLAELQTNLKSEISQIMTSNFAAIVAEFTRIFNILWNNPTLTPQQAFDALGTDAVSIFTIAAAFQTAINTAVPNSLTLTPPLPFTANSDGTVTINETQ